MAVPNQDISTKLKCQSQALLSVDIECCRKHCKRTKASSR